MKDELLDIIEKIKNRVADTSNMVWTKYNSPIELRDELNIYIGQIQLNDFDCINELNSLFGPTASLQEHAIDNSWTEEYMTLALKFDSLHKNWMDEIIRNAKKEKSESNLKEIFICIT